MDNFEVLSNNGSFTWQHSSNGSFPPNAVVGGRTANGETLYVGRAKHGHLTIPGKVHPSHQCLYLACDWKEHMKKNYEVLVRNSNTGWIPPTQIPPFPIQPVPPTFPPHIPPGGGHGHSSGEYFLTYRNGSFKNLKIFFF